MAMVPAASAAAAFPRYSKRSSRIRVHRTVTSIPNQAFCQYEKLVAVELPAGLQRIGIEAFAVCRSLKELHLWEGLQDIGYRAFCCCTSLESITIPSTVIVIPDSAFHCCIALKEVHLMEGLRRIGDDAFNGCISLTSIVIPSTVQAIGSDSFRDCLKMKKIQLQNGLRHIGDNAFHNCISHTSIMIPSTVQTIGSESFRDCSKLKNIRLQNGLRRVGDKAFHNCYSLVSVTIPSSVEAIGVEAFSGCYSLMDFTLSVREMPDSLFRHSKVKKVHLCEGVRAIGAGFRSCWGVKQVKIPSTVTAIDDRAFFDCDDLNEIQLREGLLSIGESSFSHTSLKQIRIPSTVTTIDAYSFAECKTLMEVHLCEGLESTDLLSIGRKAFSECKSLITINISSTVTAIEKDAFDECPLLRNVSISPSSSLGKVVEFESTFSNIAKVGCTFEMLRGRFDNLPVHRLCFCRLHQSVEQNNTCELLKDMILHPTTNGDKVDCLGMTPLHVLACSGTTDLRLYRCLIDHYPDALITKDKWGETPLFYVLLSEPSMEVMHYFFEMYRRKWGTIPIDFGEIIKMLAKYKSIDYVRYTIKAQRTYFPGLKIDWKNIIDESFAYIWVGRLLLKASSFAGSREMSSEREAEVKRRRSDYFASDHRNKEARDEIHRLIIDSIRVHNEFLVDASTILEMVLWKMMLKESSHQRKRKKIVDRQARMDIRLNNGKMFQAVIPSVMSFL